MAHFWLSTGNDRSCEYRFEKRSAWLGLLWMSFLLIKSEAWFTSDETEGELGLWKCQFTEASRGQGGKGVARV